MEMLVYLLKVSASIALFYLSYVVFLKKTTFFSLNRYYLVLSLILSFILPFVQFNIFNESEFSKIVSQGISSFDFSDIPFNNQLIDNTRISTINMQSLLLTLYLCGFFFYTFRIIFGSLKIKKAIRIRQVIPYEGKKLVLVNNNWCFSLFNKIYINQNKLNDESTKFILDHELAHIKQFHSIDLFLSELASALLWFNPFVFFHKKSLKSVHEYLADEYVMIKNHSFSNYVETLIEHNYFRSFELAHDFKSSTIKNRVKMMTSHKSNKLNKVRYFIAIPLTFMLVFLFSKSELAGQIAPITPQQMMKQEDVPPSPQPLSYENENFPNLSPIYKANILKVSNGWGEFINPFTKEKTFHNGIDLAAKNGTPVIASASGTIVKIESQEKGWGLFIQIKHTDGFETFYAHLSAFNVELNQQVKKGDVIGYVGNTGQSTGPHLHYAIKLNGEYKNPSDFIIF